MWDVFCAGQRLWGCAMPVIPGPCQSPQTVRGLGTLRDPRFQDNSTARPPHFLVSAAQCDGRDWEIHLSQVSPTCPEIRLDTLRFSPASLAQHCNSKGSAAAWRVVCQAEPKLETAGLDLSSMWGSPCKWS